MSFCMLLLRARWWSSVVRWWAIALFTIMSISGYGCWRSEMVRWLELRDVVVIGLMSYCDPWMIFKGKEVSEQRLAYLPLTPMSMRSLTNPRSLRRA